jgi:MFS family permease
MVGPVISYNTGIGRIRIYYGWIVLVVCLLLVTMSYGIRFSFGVFFKALEQDFAWTRAMMSGVFSIHMLLTSLFSIIGGWLSDRYGPKMVIMVMGLFAFIGLLLTSQATTLWHLFITYSLFVAVGIGPIYIIASSVATKWFKERRGLALAIVTSGSGLGALIMAPVAAYFIESFGWRISFALMAFIALIVIIPCSLFLKKAPLEVTNLSESRNQKAINHNPFKEQKKDTKDFSLIEAIKTRNFFLVFIIWFFYAFCLFTVMTHIVPHAIDLGITPIQAASIVSVMGLANIPNRILMGFATDRFGRKPIAFINAFAMAAALVLLYQSSSIWMLYIFAAIFGAAYGGLAPCTLAIIGDVFGVRNIGVIFGALEIGWVSGAAAGPAFAGYVFDTAGTYNKAFIFLIFAALFILILIFFLKVPEVKTRKSF